MAAEDFGVEASDEDLGRGRSERSVDPRTLVFGERELAAVGGDGALGSSSKVRFSLLRSSTSK